MCTHTIPFAKMNGAGNEIIVADIRFREGRVTGDFVKTLADDPSLSFDQLMCLQDPEAGSGIVDADAYVQIFNRDGSVATACGNGMRCIGAILSVETGRKHFLFQTASGLISTTMLPDGRVSVDMGFPRFHWEQIPLAEAFADTSRIELQIGPIDAPVLHSPSAVNMGNPHIIFWVSDNLDSYDLSKIGALLEQHPILPEGANISIARVDDPSHIRLRVWERGVGLTQSCGSAACAACVCAARLKMTDRNVDVIMPGGTLSVVWAKNDHVLLTGPVVHEFSGWLDSETGRWHPQSEDMAS